MRSLLTWLVAALLAGTAQGQSSPGFTLEAYAFNGGGVPAAGLELTSASFSITLASIGDGIVAGGPAGGSFSVDAGFVAGYPPPGEVAASGAAIGDAWLAFVDDRTLTWPAERSAGTYNLYRDAARDLFGECEQQDLAGPTATDATVPGPGAAYYYLVTSQNRLGEEGTRGFSTVGLTRIERAGTVCP